MELVANADGGLERIGRYEDRIERSLFKALHELQRVQAGRGGKTPAPTETIDVDVTIDLVGGQSSGFDLSGRTDSPRDDLREVDLHEVHVECALSK